MRLTKPPSEGDCCAVQPGGFFTDIRHSEQKAKYWIKMTLSIADKHEEYRFFEHNHSRDETTMSTKSERRWKLASIILLVVLVALFVVLYQTS
ncbi:hypothetical protein FJU30_05520 [Affinibrenneria salicis]|uniref:Uncharacterized protein n=1 Tax=Affinibrenneria salicis TaxID=2590031 RepID=A0A5J5G3X4_9GAMM|nr:hypothetical protein [Affinibrenneria salicis]KAA9001751.1 hypothetical protein FJU30_05520 [Affinibrenneria salicis]